MVIGCGSIGTEIIKKYHDGFGMNITAVDKEPQLVSEEIKKYSKVISPDQIP